MDPSVYFIKAILKTNIHFTKCTVTTLHLTLQIQFIISGSKCNFRAIFSAIFRQCFFFHSKTFDKNHTVNQPEWYKSTVSLLFHKW